MPAHKHVNLFEIIYVLEGSLSLYTQEYTFEIRKGDVAIFFPEQVHGFLNDTYAPHQAYFMQIDLSFRHQNWAFWPDKSSTPASFFHSLSLPFFPVTPLFRNYFEQLLLEHQNRDEYSEINARSLLNNILVELLRSYRKHMRKPSIPAIEPSTLLNKVNEIIKERLSANITCFSMANALNMSERHLSRVVRNITGLPPMKYVQQYRIHHAKKCLLEDRVAIATLAQDLAFSSPAHFTKTFKDFTGITPSQYRKAIRKEFKPFFKNKLAQINGQTDKIDIQFLN